MSDVGKKEPATNVGSEEVWKWLKGHFWQLTTMASIGIAVWTAFGNDFLKHQVKDYVEAQLVPLRETIQKVKKRLRGCRYSCG